MMERLKDLIAGLSTSAAAPTDRGAAARTGDRSRLRPGRDVLAAEHDGAAVLLDLRRGVYFGLDEVGTSIWRQVEAGARAGSIPAALTEEYDAPAEALQEDVRRFVDELVRRGLVVRS